MHVGGVVHQFHTDLIIDDLALAGPGIGSGAYSYHFRVGS